MGQIIGLNNGIVDPLGCRTTSPQKKMEIIKEAFEKRFGVDQSRTPAQWGDLVATYGMKVVIEKERMSEGAIKRKMKGD